MTAKAVRNRVDRISDRIGHNRGELIHVTLIDTYMDDGKPDRVIEIKLFSKTGEMYVKPDNIVDKKNLEAIPVDNVDFNPYDERVSLAQLWHTGD